MEKVDVIEIWQPVKEGGEAYSLEKGSLKRVALIVNGYPFYLEKDWGMEKITMSKEEAINKGLITTFPDTQEKKLTNGGKPHVCGQIAVHNNSIDTDTHICANCLMPVDNPELSDTQEKKCELPDVEKLTGNISKAIGDKEYTPTAPEWEERLKPEVVVLNEDDLNAKKIVEAYLNTYWKSLKPEIESLLQAEREKILRDVFKMVNQNSINGLHGKYYVYVVHDHQIKDYAQSIGVTLE
jgi:hypothetical protein